MAVAPEVVGSILAATAKGAHRGAPPVWNRLPSGGQQPATQILTKLIWAVALGLIVLQIGAEATGRYWDLHIPGLGAPPPKQPYLPLYAGQQLSGAMPGVLPPTASQTAPGVPAFTGSTSAPTLPLSNRSAGNQAWV